MDLRQSTPWSALPYFAMPVEQAFSSPGTGVLFARPDPLRVLLIFAASPGTNLLISTNPNGPNNAGLPLPTHGEPILITWETHGPLVCSGWYNVTNLTPTVTVISVSLRGQTLDARDPWSGVPPPPATRPPQQITTAPGVGGGQGLLDYWRKLVAKFGGGK